MEEYLNMEKIFNFKMKDIELMNNTSEINVADLDIAKCS